MSVPSRFFKIVPFQLTKMFLCLAREIQFRSSAIFSSSKSPFKFSQIIRGPVPRGRHSCVSQSRSTSPDRGVLTREECEFRGYRDRNYDVRSLCRQEFAKMIAFITSLPFRQKKVSDLSFRSSCRDCRPLAVLKGIVVRSGIAWSRIRCDATPVSNNFSIFNLFPIGPHP
jgi:hypothetical protein